MRSQCYFVTTVYCNVSCRFVKSLPFGGRQNSVAQIKELTQSFRNCRVSSGWTLLANLFIDVCVNIN